MRTLASIGRRFATLLARPAGRAPARGGGIPHTVVPAPPQYDWADALHAQQMATLRTADRLDLLLVGDSLAQHWPLGAWSPGRALSLGIGGDGTQHILWRIERIAWASCRPERILIVAGTNNLLAGDGPADIAAGIEAVAVRLAAAHPTATVSVLLPPPLGVGPAGGAVTRRALRALLARRFGTRLIEADTALGEPGATPNPSYQDDRVHLTDRGYAVLTDMIQSARR